MTFPRLPQPYVAGVNIFSPTDHVDEEISQREQQKLMTRESILQVAERLFLTNNYDAVSTTEIAQQSDVAKGTIFHHFDNKERLAIAVLNRVFKRFLDQFHQLKQELTKPDQILRSFLEEMFGIMVNQPGMTSLLLHLTTTMEEGTQSVQAELVELFDLMMGDFMAEFVNIFDELGYDNPEIKARILFGMVDGLGLQLYLEQLTPGSTPNKLVSELIDEIMSLLLQEG